MTTSTSATSSASDFDIQPFLLLEPLNAGEMTKLQRFYKNYMYYMVAFSILCIVILVALLVLNFLGVISSEVIKEVPNYAIWVAPLMPLMILGGLFLEIITPDYRIKERANMALRMKPLTTQQIDAIIAHPQVDKEVVVVAQDELLQRFRHQAPEETTLQ